MQIIEDPKIQETRATLLEGMVDFMDEDSAYNQAHVDQCDSIIANYIATVASISQRAELLKAVESTVLEINSLNEQAEHELIETDQREDICAIIIRAGFLGGFNKEDEDVTEEWREW